MCHPKLGNYFRDGRDSVVILAHNQVLLYSSKCGRGCLNADLAVGKQT